MTNDELVRFLLPDVQRAGRTIAREWADVIDAEDVEQEIWWRLIDSSQNYLGAVADLKTEPRQALLAKIGHQIALQYRDDFERFSGNHRYGTYQVKDLLEAGVLDRVADESIVVWELPESVVRQIERTDNETLSEMVDLFEGLKDLHRRNERYAEFIVAVYRDGSPIHGHSQNLTRAIDALTVSMNNCHRRQVANYLEGPGTRQVISNEKARMVSQRQYSGHGSSYNSFAQ